MSSSLRAAAQLVLQSTPDPAHAPLACDSGSPAARAGSPAGSGPLQHGHDVDLLLATILPAAAILLAFGTDVFSRLPYPPALRRAARTLSSPFRDFFTLSDVEAPTPSPLHGAPWKARVLVIGSVAQSIAWLAVLVYREEVGDWQGGVQAGVVFLAWVRIPSLPVVKRADGRRGRDPDVRVRAGARQAASDAPVPAPMFLRDERARGASRPRT